MKKIVSLIIALGLTIQAFSFRLEYGNNVVITRPVYEDLYISAGSVTINAPVFGDLICTGGTVNINDSVSDDIIVAGGTVTFNGYVGDDVRCAGGRLYVQKKYRWRPGNCRWAGYCQQGRCYRRRAADGRGQYYFQWYRQ